MLTEKQGFALLGVADGVGAGWDWVRIVILGPAGAGAGRDWVCFVISVPRGAGDAGNWVRIVIWGLEGSISAAFGLHFMAGG